MNKKYFSWILMVTFIGTATACTAASAVNDDMGNPEILTTEVETEIIQMDRTTVDGPELDAEVDKDIVVGTLTIEPTDVPEVESVDTPVVQEHDDFQCEDPFTGLNVRFSDAGWDTNFCLHSVPYDEFLSGGPPRDGISPIDSPNFVAVDSANDWLADQEPVISLEINEVTRAYPLQILIWHEIVNDIVGDVPVVVTFCPLCNTALVFVRPSIDGDLLTFGTSGNLRNSDLVMWDRQTESWWQQFTGEAIVSDLTGTQLEFLPTAILSWGDFKTKYPDGKVLSRDHPGRISSHVNA